MVPQWRDPAPIGTIPAQVPITSTMSPHLTIQLQFLPIEKTTETTIHRQEYHDICIYPKEYKITAKTIDNNIHCDTTGKVLGYKYLVKKDYPV